MGKKRRLKSASAKFGIKHSAHPRAKLLATLEEDICEETEPLTAPTVEKVEIPALKVKAPEPPPVTTTPEEPRPTVTKAPSVTKKKVVKVAARPAPKATVKKTTTTKKAITPKKTAATRKRSTKTKTKSTSA